MPTMTEQFIFTDRRRGEGANPAKDGGFQVAARSPGLAPPLTDKLAVLAGEIGQFFGATVAMNRPGAPPVIGSAANPLWCWTPLNDAFWVLARSVYIGQCVSSSRPQGNYLVHAIVLQPADLRDVQYNPVSLALALAHRELFWSEDRKLTDLHPVPLTAVSVNWSKVGHKMPQALAQDDALVAALSLLLQLREQPDAHLLFSNGEAELMWQLMGYLLSRAPHFVRAGTPLSNVSFRSFIKSVTMRQCFVGMPEAMAAAASYRLPGVIAEIDLRAGRITPAEPQRPLRKLAQWAVAHQGGSTAKLFAQAEAGALADEWGYEGLCDIYDLLEKQALVTAGDSAAAGDASDLPPGPTRVAAAAPNPPAAATTATAAPGGGVRVGGTVPATLDDLSKRLLSVALSWADEDRGPWVRSLMSDILEARYERDDRAGVGAVLRFLRDQNFPPPATGTTSDFFARLGERVLNRLRKNDWRMIASLLEFLPPARQSATFLGACAQAGAAIRPPDLSDRHEVLAFYGVIRRALSGLAAFPPVVQFTILTDLLFRMFGAPESKLLNTAIKLYLTECAALLRNGGPQLDPTRVQQLCDSPGISLVPEVPLLCARLRIPQLAESLQVVGDDDDARSKFASDLGAVLSSIAERLRNCADPNFEAASILDAEMAALPRSPPWRGVALAMFWEAAPATCRELIFEEFCLLCQPAGLRPRTVAPPRATALATTDLDPDWLPGDEALRPPRRAHAGAPTPPVSTTGAFAVGPLDHAEAFTAEGRVSEMPLAATFDLSPAAAAPVPPPNAVLPESRPNHFRDREWLLDRLVDQAKLGAVLRWTIQSDDPGVLRWFGARLRVFGDAQRLIVLNALAGVLSEGLTSLDGLWELLVSLADDPACRGYGADVQASLMKSLVYLARPGCTLPQLLGDRTALLDHTDQLYVRFLANLQQICAEPTDGAVAQPFWLRVWDALPAHEPATLSDCMDPARGRSLGCWILEELSSRPVRAAAEIEVLERMLTFVGFDDRWTEASGRMIESHGHSWFDQFTLVIWAARRHAFPLPGRQLPPPLAAMLERADAMALGQIGRLSLDVPVGEISTELMQLLQQQATFVRQQRDREARRGGRPSRWFGSRKQGR
jgi:hypothetical protein